MRVDAATRLARAKLGSGDYEMALNHTTDALATATRFGMSLRKIGLRIRIGQILIRRGDRRSGTAMIDSAIEQADRIDYQRAVALAQRVRSTEGISF